MIDRKQLNMPRAKKAISTIYIDGPGDMTRIDVIPTAEPDAITEAAEEMDSAIGKTIEELIADGAFEGGPSLTVETGDDGLSIPVAIWHRDTLYPAGAPVYCDNSVFEAINSVRASYPADEPDMWKFVRGMTDEDFADYHGQAGRGDGFEDCRPQAPTPGNDQPDAVAFANGVVKGLVGATGGPAVEASTELRATYYKRINRRRSFDDNDPREVRLASMNLQILELKKRKKAKALEFQHEIDEWQEQAGKLSEEILADMADEVAVQDFYNPKTDCVEVRRRDTGSLLETRPAKDRDRHPSLPLEEGAPADPEPGLLTLTWSATTQYQFGDLCTCTIPETDEASTWRCVQGCMGPSPVSEFGPSYWARVDPADVDDFTPVDHGHNDPSLDGSEHDDEDHDPDDEDEE